MDRLSEFGRGILAAAVAPYILPQLVHHLTQPRKNTQQKNGAAYYAGIVGGLITDAAQGVLYYNALNHGFGEYLLIPVFTNTLSLGVVQSRRCTDRRNQERLERIAEESRPRSEAIPGVSVHLD